MRKLLGVFLVVGVLLTAATALADPNLPNVPRHQHFVLTPTGKLVQVGPRFCDNPSLQDAFNQFHFNIHHSSGAPGLHNFQGAEIRFGACPP